MLNKWPQGFLNLARGTPVTPNPKTLNLEPYCLPPVAKCNIINQIERGFGGFKSILISIDKRKIQIRVF